MGDYVVHGNLEAYSCEALTQSNAPSLQTHPAKAMLLLQHQRDFAPVYLFVYLHSLHITHGSDFPFHDGCML